MQNPRNPQNLKILSGYAPDDHAETAEKGHRIKSKFHKAMLGLDPKRSKGKFQNFKMNAIQALSQKWRVGCPIPKASGL